MSIWRIEYPKDCPVRHSDDITGVSFTGRYEIYTAADTWYLSWAGDGNLYSPYTNGDVDEALTLNSTTGANDIFVAVSHVESEG